MCECVCARACMCVGINCNFSWLGKGLAEPIAFQGSPNIGWEPVRWTAAGRTHKAEEEQMQSPRGRRVPSSNTGSQCMWCGARDRECHRLNELSARRDRGNGFQEAPAPR